MKFWLLSSILLWAASPSGIANWSVNPKNGNISYPPNESGIYASLDDALKESAKVTNIHNINSISAFGLLSDSDFQLEIFSILEDIAPAKLHAALTSKGNMHNPAVTQLWGSFKIAFLKTATIQELNSSLGRYNLTILSPEVEKFELREFQGKHRFSGTLSLKISTKPVESLKAEQGAAANP